MKYTDLVADHLILNFTTMGLLGHVKDLFASNLPLMLHIDSTYKLNNYSNITLILGFPVVLFVLSDSGGRSHPFSMSVTSHESVDDYVQIIKALQLHCEKQGVELKPSFIMRDASDALTRAIEQCFPNTLQLMCFFHLTQCIKRKTKCLKLDMAQKLKKEIKYLSLSDSREKFKSKLENQIREWEQTPVLEAIGFAKYFKKGWVDSTHSNWQVYLTPPGFAMTNNPCEIQNSLLKKR